VTRISARWLAAAVLFAWTLLPAIACAADLRQMTEPEMACCKKMAGDCSMGTSEHPCCKTVSSLNPPVATIQTVSHIDRVLAVVSVITDNETTPVFDVPLVQSHVGLPSPAPPGTDSILRI